MKNGILTLCWVMGLLLASSSLMAQNRMATVNRDEVIQKMPEFVKLQKELSTTAETVDEKLRAIQEMVAQKEARVLEARRLGNASQQQLEAELASLQREMSSYIETQQTMLDGLRVERMQVILTKFNEATRVVAARKGYTHVMNANVEGVQELIIYPAEEDITDAVVAQLGIVSR